jgi:hypothetical protein
MHDGRGADRAFLGDDSRGASAGRLDAAGGAELMHRSAGLEDAACDHRCGPRGIRRAIRRREDAALPALAGRAAAGGSLLGGEHMGDHTHTGGEVAPFCPTGELSIVVAEIEQAAAPKTEIFADIHCEAVPQGEAFRRQRQLARIAVLLPAPAPVAARLLGADPPLLDESDLHAAPGEVIGRADADDAAADDDDVGAVGQCGAGVDLEQWRRHQGLLAEARLSSSG